MNNHPRSGKRMLSKSEILFKVKRAGNNSLRLKVNDVAKVRALSFKGGSALFVSLFKALAPRLRKYGYAPQAAGPVNPFGVLTGYAPLPFKRVSRPMLKEDAGSNECVLCKPPGGCVCIECDKIGK